MLETVVATSSSSFLNIKSEMEPLPWETTSQPFPDSNSKFSPIKQEIVEPFDINVGQTQSNEFTELKPLPFDYTSNSLTGIDPVLNNNNNNNNNNNKLADLYINIKPLSPDFNRESFPFHASPSDVTSSGSISPQGMTKIDFSTDQNAFDDLGNIVGMPVGADSTVPSIENDLDIEAWIENTAQDIKPLPLLPNENNGGFDTPNSSMASNSNSHSINNHTLTNTQPYISSISSLIKGSRMTIVEPRDSFQTNLSPILRGAITGTYPLTSYPQIKFESVEMMKPEYYQEQMPHSTTIPGDIHRRLNAQDMLRSKPKPPKIRQVKKVLILTLSGLRFFWCLKDRGKGMDSTPPPYESKNL